MAGRLVGFLLVCYLLSGCMGINIDKAHVKTPKPNLAWTERIVTEEELIRLREKDPELTYDACLEILTRLNSKDQCYIAEDINKKQRLRVPHDFSAYKKWTPLPKSLSHKVKAPKFVLIVKDIPYIGWYEEGKLIGDSYVCIGKQRKWTQKGLYKVLEKDPLYVSKKYTNAYGTPALMPHALRIYGGVWIHGGDIIGAYCSHGCINLPLDPAEQLFNWAKVGTTVLITESLQELEKNLEARDDTKTRVDSKKGYSVRREEKNSFK